MAARSIHYGVYGLSRLAFVPIIALALLALAIVVVASLRDKEEIVFGRGWGNAGLLGMLVKPRISGAVTLSKLVDVIDIAENIESLVSSDDCGLFDARHRKHLRVLVKEIVISHEKSVEGFF